MKRSGYEATVELDAPTLPAAVYLNVLSISAVPKRVPYEGTGVRRADGGANFGFVNAKAHPERLDSIPELAVDPALRSLIATLARPETGAFAIACDSRRIADDRGCRHRGYVELALNDRKTATDPAAYFALFLDFDRLLRRAGFADPVSFQWDICPIRFTDACLDGFAVDVRVETAPHAEPAVAYERWDRALAILERALANVPIQSGGSIYSTEP